MPTRRLPELPQTAVLTLACAGAHPARERALAAMEDALRTAFPQYAFYRAWGNSTDSRSFVHQVMEKMLGDGITEVLSLPLLLLDGNEHQRLTAEIAPFQNRFRRISYGRPLLSAKEDCEAVIRAVEREFSDLKKEEALVFMGHGSASPANGMYARLNRLFPEMGYPNIFLGTLKAEPSLDSLWEDILSYAPRKIILAPFLLTAGSHAHADLAGISPRSWRSRFQTAGFSTEVRLRGLGEYPAIQALFAAHLEELHFGHKKRIVL